MASTAFGATISDVLDLLPGTVASDFDGAGTSSTPAGEAEIANELARQERSITSRMPADLAARVRARSGRINELADVCATCAAARLGLRTEGADSGTPPLHVAQLAADCDGYLKAIEAGRFNPPGLGTAEAPPPPSFRCVPCDNG